MYDEAFDDDLMFDCEQKECWEYERLTGNMIRSRWIIVKEIYL